MSVIFDKNQAQEVKEEVLDSVNSLLNTVYLDSEDAGKLLEKFEVEKVDYNGEPYYRLYYTEDDGHRVPLVDRNEDASVINIYPKKARGGVFILEEANGLLTTSRIKYGKGTAREDVNCKVLLNALSKIVGWFTEYANAQGAEIESSYWTDFLDVESQKSYTSEITDIIDALSNSLIDNYNLYYSYGNGCFYYHNPEAEPMSEYKEVIGRRSGGLVYVYNNQAYVLKVKKYQAIYTKDGVAITARGFYENLKRLADDITSHNLTPETVKKMLAAVNEEEVAA